MEKWFSRVNFILNYTRTMPVECSSRRAQPVKVKFLIKRSTNLFFFFFALFNLSKKRSGLNPFMSTFFNISYRGNHIKGCKTKILRHFCIAFFFFFCELVVNLELRQLSMGLAHWFFFFFFCLNPHTIFYTQSIRF